MKWLWTLADGAQVETVLMHYPDRSTVCVSHARPAAPWRCGFCATGQAGFDRHLTVGEIVEQVVRAGRTAADGRTPGGCPTSCSWAWASRSPTTTATWASIERIHGDLGLSARHLTVSTVGIVPGIRRLAGEDLPVNLAVSLHAANDELRDELVPINRRYPLERALRGLRRSTSAAKHRRLSFEWALIDGVNDRPADAAELAGCRPPAAGPREPHPAQPHAGLRRRAARRRSG